jgi:tripartite-type tricarboxylate transporter receptor subunit TctC
LKALAMPQTKQRAMEQGIEILSSTPGEFSAFIHAETVKWANVARNAGLVEK